MTGLRTALHAFLDRLRNIVPERIRTVIRTPYLELFYYRVYPDHRNQPKDFQNPDVTQHREAAEGRAAPLAYSQYESLLKLKRRIVRSLPLLHEQLRSGRISGMVSIVLPVYNGATFVRDSIESVLAQTYSPLELIIVDDGSTDNTPAILDEYAGDTRITIICQSNCKLPRALNSGFSRAKGELVTWTSADNVMAPSCITTLASFMQTHPAVELVYGDMELIDEAGDPLTASGFLDEFRKQTHPCVVQLPRDPGKLNFVPGNYIGGCFLYRAWTSAVLGDYLSTAFGFEDYEYWMRMNSLFRIAHLGSREILYRYRVHSCSLTAQAEQLHLAGRIQAFFQTERLRQKWFAKDAEVVLIGRHQWFSTLTELYVRSGHMVHQVTDLGQVASRVRATKQSKVLGIIDSATALSGLPSARQAVTDSCDVSALFVNEALPTNDIQNGFDCIVGIDKSLWSTVSSNNDIVALVSSDPNAIAYPLIALLNRLSFERRQRRLRVSEREDAF